MSHLTFTIALRNVALAGMACLALAPSPAHGARPTLKTITVDGDLADWEQILLNPAQASSDGERSSLPCDVSIDRDCREPASGPDARVFAWSFDDSNVYLHVRWQEVPAGSHVAWLYFDLAGPDGLTDGLMGSDDRVLRVRHDTLSGSTSKALFEYVPSAPQGDPLADRGGHADGHVLPGETGALLWQESAQAGGSADGLAFEEHLPWSALGTEPGSPMHFHVATSSSALPGDIASRVDDNLGGPDGGRGFIGVTDFALGPGHRAALRPGESIRHVHELRNLGSLPAAFAIATTSSRALRVALREDSDADGSYETLLAEDGNGDGDYTDPGDTLARDADGDGFPEIPASPALLMPGAAHAVAVEVRASPGPGGMADRTTLSAWLASAALASRVTATNVTLIGDVILDVREPMKLARAAEDVGFAVTTCNEGAPDVVDLAAFSGSASPVSLFADHDCDGVANLLLAVDANGDGAWDLVVAGDSDGDGWPDTGLLDSAACACHVAKLAVPGGSEVGTAHDVTLVGTGSANSSSGSASLSVEVGGNITFGPDHARALGTEIATTRGRSVYFAHVARNNWSVPAAVELAATIVGTDPGWPVRFWSDPDGDGNIADGRPIARTEVLAPNGGTAGIILEVQVPSVAAIGSDISVLITATSTADASQVARATDELVVSSLATFADPLHLRPASAFAPCDAVHARAADLEGPGLGWPRDSHELAWFDGARELVDVLGPLMPDADGLVTDRRETRPPEAPGRWTLELTEDGAVTERHDFRVEALGRVDRLTSAQPRVTRIGERLAVVSELVNDNIHATLAPSVVEHVILDPTFRYSLASGLPSGFVPTDGSLVTRRTFLGAVAPGGRVDASFVIPAVTYPVEGTYWLLARWRSTCGLTIAEAFSTFLVVAGEACADGVDNDGDGLADCFDADCHALDADCDGDGAPDLVDCSPGDPSTLAAPDEVARLHVVKVSNWPGSIAEIRWIADAPAGASATGHDVVSGRLHELWADGGFSRATCHVAGIEASPAWDARHCPGTERGFYYLVRSRNSCGSGGWGSGSLGVERSIAPELCR